VLALAATQRPAGHAWVALAVVADAPQVAPAALARKMSTPRLMVCAVPWRRRPRGASADRGPLRHRW
jgi:hypothetical protein